MTRIAILDNSVLANFIDSGHIDLLLQTQTIFQYFLIPEKIRSEFINVTSEYRPEREHFADTFNYPNSFYRLCTTFDSIILGIAQSLVDPGEAEAIAQARKQNVYLFFTDDQNCREVIEEEFSWLRTMDTLSLIAMLDIAEVLPNAPDVWRSIYKMSGFDHNQLKQAVNNAFFLIGIRPDKKMVSEKASWKRIFGEPPKKKTVRWHK
jgi:predicted nucleic acid-binding protein